MTAFGNFSRFNHGSTGNFIPIEVPTICLFLPSLDGGGAERVFVQLANKFATLGIRVHLLLAAARGPYLNEVADGVRIIELGGGGVLRSLPKLVKYLRSERPTVILSGLDHSNIVAILACSLARLDVRCVISVRAVPSAVYREEKLHKKWAFTTLMRKSYRRADRIIANSRTAALDLVENFRVQQQNLSVIYNPIDLALIERLSQESVLSPWLRSGASPLILGVGRLDNLKDFPTLIRAFSLVRSRRLCRLAILGEGSDRKHLEDLVAELGLQRDVHFAGFVSNPFAWMRVANVLVSSSLTEGCPNALMQGLACGTPIVSTDCIGGSSEVLEDGRWGRLVPMRDAPAMAAAIDATLDCTFPVDVKKRAANFAIDTIARAYLQVLVPNFAPSRAGR